MQHPATHDPDCAAAEALAEAGPRALEALITCATPGAGSRPADASNLRPCPLIQRDTLSAETRADSRRFPLVVAVHKTEHDLTPLYVLYSCESNIY